MKRVLFVERNEDGSVGGSHRILYDLVTRLPDDIQPVVLFYQDNLWVQRLRDEGVEVHAWDDVRREESTWRARGGKLSTLVMVARLIANRRRFLVEQGIDLVHMNNSPFQGRDDWLPACRWVRVPCVVYAMGDARRETQPVKRWLMRRFDRFFPLSELVRDSLLDNGVSARRIVLTYPGLDLAALAARPVRPAESVRREFGVPEERILAAMVGNVRHWKGQHVVVEAVGRLSEEQRARLVVLLIGDVAPLHEDYARDLRTRIDELGIGDSVRFTGRRDDIPDLLEAADLALHASVIPEPFGLVVLEALAHGCATVAAGSGGPAEMIRPGESGLLYDPEHPEELAAHLVSLLDDPRLRTRLSEAGRERARAFDIDRHVELVVGEYRTLLD